MFHRVLQTDLHDLVEEPGELRLVDGFEDVPTGDAFPVLLVHHDDNGDGVTVRGFTGNVVRPQILLQVLTELQHDDSPVPVLSGVADLRVVNLLDDSCIVWCVIALCAGVPILLGELEEGMGVSRENGRE